MRRSSLAVLVAGAVAAAAVATPAHATRYGAADVRGAIEAKYLALCGPSGVLGFPTTNELTPRDGTGRYNQFQHGSIYWTPSTGAHEVHGAIGRVWGATAWEVGILGYPITDETSTPYKHGRYNAFQRGSVYWSPETGAHEVHGEIRDAWSRTGWENGPLGFPTSWEFDIPGGRMNTFQGGDITWTPQGGAVVNAYLPVPASSPVPIPPCVPAPPPPSGSIVLVGSGSAVVGVDKPAGPMVARLRNTGPIGSDVTVYPVSGSSTGVPLLTDAPDQVVPLDFNLPAGRSRQTTGFDVVSNTFWEITLVPLSAVGTFGQRQTIGEARSTVWRYTGPAGTARLTKTAGTGTFRVIAYDTDTRSPQELAHGVGVVDRYVPIKANQYLEITADGPWAITVL